MSKFRSTILIIGLVIIAVAAALLTVLVFYATGTIVTDPIELVYTVHGDTKTYDGTPLTLEDGAYTLDSGEILEGHTAQVKIIGSQTNAGESEATLEVKIFDKKGFDVSDEYAVKVNTGTLTVEQRDLSVYIEGGQEVFYNGKEVFFNDYQIEGDNKLVKGHRIAGTNDSIINVGTLPLDVKPVIYDAFDNDVTENYNINFSAGEVKVVPRPLTLKPKSVSKVYDGTPLTATEYEIVSGSFAPGQTAKYEIIFTGGGEATRVNCTDELYIEFKEEDFKILGEDGKPVNLDNYELSLETALFTIAQRPITILTATQTFTYDGKDHYNDSIQFLAGSLAPNQNISVTSYETVCDVADGPAENKLTCNITFNNEPVNGNYDINYINGKLSVEQQKLMLYARDYKKEYDGKSLGDLIDNDDTNYDLKADLDLNFKVKTVCPASVKNQKDVKSGTYSLQNITVSLGGDDVTENFDIIVIEGKYSITKKPITVKPVSVSVVYDGTEHKIESFEYVEGSIVSGQSAQAAFTFESDNSVAKSVNCIDSVVKMNLTIKAGEQDVSTNYLIDCLDGTLTVTPRPITVKPKDMTQVYDGKAHTVNDYEITDGSLATGHRISATYVNAKNEAATATDVVDTFTNISVFEIYSGSDPVKTNYDINFESGKLTITRKPISITLNDITDTYTYDGNKKDISNLSVSKAIDNSVLTGYGLTQADFKLVSDEEMIDAGTYNYTANFVNAKANNYSVEIIPATVVIKKMKVTVSVKAGATLSMVYGGSNALYSDDQSIINKLNLSVNNYTISSVDYSVAFDIANALQTVKVNGVEVAGGGKDVTSNLEITYQAVSINVTVTKRQLNLFFNTYTSQYFVEDVKDLEGYVTVSEMTPLVGGDTFKILTMATDDSDWFWVGSYKILNDKGQDVSHLYTDIVTDGSSMRGILKIGK